jgi:hypothetical protein
MKRGHLEKLHFFTFFLEFRQSVSNLWVSTVYNILNTHL